MNLHYAAGLFDGEGWFQIDRARRRDTRRGFAYQVHARIVIRQQDVLLRFQAAFGGSLRRSQEATEKRAAYWSWDVCGEQCRAFAVLMENRLVIKREQAILAARFHSLKSENKNQPCSDERWEAMTVMYERMKFLNRKGPR